jgi:hypothetical protein
MESLESLCLAFRPLAKRHPLPFNALRHFAVLSPKLSPSYLTCACAMYGFILLAGYPSPKEEVLSLYVLLSLTLASSVVSRSMREIQLSCSHRRAKHTTFGSPACSMPLFAESWTGRSVYGFKRKAPTQLCLAGRSLGNHVDRSSLKSAPPRSSEWHC